MPKLDSVFSELKTIMLPYADRLEVTKNDEVELCIYTRHIQKNGKSLFFGAVQIRKAYVSYHLMPVYVKPELLLSVSPHLKRRMQGKSCFNFSLIDEPLFEELAALTKAGFASYVQQGFVKA